MIACADTADRRALADDLAAAGGLEPARIAAGAFELAVWRRRGRDEAITVYIEGDGYAWIDRSRPSPDPTPRRPMAPALAARDPAPVVAAVARPCQYRGNAPQPRCDDPTWWTDGRFAEPVIDSIDRAVDALKREAGAQRVHLVGFSGGAAVALLVAVRRADVASLRTVAGNLDPDGVSSFHGVNPLRGSGSPMEVAVWLSRVPQLHFVGSRDTVVPPAIARGFVAAMGASPCVRVVEVDSDHHDGWARNWPDLLALIPACS